MTTTSSIGATSFTPTTAPTAPTVRGPRDDPDGDGDHDGGGGGARVSKMGQMMGQLADLEKTDPAKAQAALTKIATTLSDQAKASGDTKLASLADKFSQAAQSGDLSALQGGKHGGGGHHHHGAGGPNGASAATASYAQHGVDVRQTVEDAVASALGQA